jgi:hypothetical protein
LALASLALLGAKPRTAKAGYQPIRTLDGDPSIRVLVDRGGKTAYDVLQGPVAPGGSVDKMIKNLPAGQEIDTQLAEAEIAKHRNDWTKDKNGEAYKQRLEQAWGRDPTAELRSAGRQLEEKLQTLLAAAKEAAIAAAKGRRQAGEQVIPPRQRGGVVKG